MKYLIGIDIGTSGTKAVLFNENGETVASFAESYPLYCEQNGYAEQEPKDWSDATVKCLKNITGVVNPSDILGVGLSGQMHGLVLLDANDAVIRKSIIWCDLRTQQEVLEITKKVGEERLIEITANPAVAGFTNAKLLWVKNNEKENYLKAKTMLLPKDYVRFCLTGEKKMEVSDASGTGLLNIKKRQWSKEICSLLDIDFSILPPVYESEEIGGYITSEIAKETGLLKGTPVVLGAGDQAAAAIGNGIVKEGIISDTLGTSGVVFAHTDAPLIDKLGRVHTFCHAVKNKWHIMGVTQGCGLSMQWAKENLTKNLSFDEINEKIDKTKIGAESLIFLPYLQGERHPHLDNDCRGVFFGLSSIHRDNHLCRAVMEGVCYSQADCLNVIRELGVTANEIRVGGGGAKSKVWKQMLADIFQTSTVVVNSTEGGALGVAILAGVAVGLYESVEKACEKIIRVSETTKPTGADYSKFYNLYRKLYLTNKELFKEL